MGPFLLSVWAEALHVHLFHLVILHNPRENCASSGHFSVSQALWGQDLGSVSKLSSHYVLFSIWESKSLCQGRERKQVKRTEGTHDFIPQKPMAPTTRPAPPH